MQGVDAKFILKQCLRKCISFAIIVKTSVDIPKYAMMLKMSHDANTIMSCGISVLRNMCQKMIFMTYIVSY